MTLEEKIKLNNSPIFYVYVFLDSSKKGHYTYDNKITFLYEPFYVGKGHGNRIVESLKYNHHQHFKNKKLNSLKEKNIDIYAIKIAEFITNSEADIIEIETIKIIERRNLNKGTLVNLTDGGDGGRNCVPSAEARINMSNAQKGSKNGFYNHKHTEEVKEKHSERVSATNHPRYRVKNSPEAREKMKIARAKLTPEMIQEYCKERRKTVLQYDLEMNFIQEFESVKAAAKALNFNESIISKCCRGVIKTPTRFYFQYADISNNIKSNKFLVNEELFYYNDKKYTIVERFTSRTHIKDEDGNIILVKNNEIEFVDYKDVNDSPFVELYMFIKSIFKNVIVDYNNYTIRTKNFTINYFKVYKNSNIFKKKYDISSTYDSSHIYLFEDYYVNNKELLKNVIKNMVSKKEILATNLSVNNVSKIDTENFLNKYCIDRYIETEYNIGIYHNNALISMLAYNIINTNIEILRFSTIFGVEILNSEQILVDYIQMIHSPTDIKLITSSIITNKYKNFINVDKTEPNCHYIIDNYNTTMNETKNYYKYYDSGNLIYQYKLLQ